MRNYTNHPGTETRGVGVALTFYAAEKTGLLGRSEDVVPELEIEFGNCLKRTPVNGLNAGLNISYFRLMMINGWDRFDSYEIKDR